MKYIASHIIKNLEKDGYRKNYREGEVILHECSYIRAIPFVTRGTVRVTRSDSDGRKLFLYYIRPGETCVNSFLEGIHGDKSKIEAVAEEDSEIIFLPIEKAAFWIKENPHWLEYLLSLYHKRFEELMEVINEIAFKKLDDRLLGFIETKSRLSQSNTLYITHEQLASHLGTSRAVISRLLKNMENQGLVKLARNKITLCNKSS
jgi:CRP/FNR family transcriptional regulator